MKQSQKRLLNNTIMLYILQISQYLFPLFTFPYLTRVLLPDRYGIVIYTQSFISYFTLFVTFGFLQSATKESAMHRSDNRKLSEIVAAVTSSKLILSFIGFIILILLLQFFKGAKGKEIFILLSYIPVFLSSFNFDYLFRGLEKMKYVTYRTVLGRAIYTVLIFVLIRKPDDYILIPIISTIGELIIIIWVWTYVRKKLNILLIPVVLKKILNAIKASSIFFVSRIATTAYTSTNTIILGLLYSDEEIAFYGVAVSLIANIRNMFSPIADSLYPYMIVKKDYKLVKNTLFILMPLVLLGVVALYFLADPIIMIMSGEEYMDAVPIFRVLLPLVLITLPIYLFGFPVLGAMDKMLHANLSVIFAAIFHLAGLATLYFTHSLNFITICLLTFATEFIILLYRFITIMIGRKQNKMKNATPMADKLENI